MPQKPLTLILSITIGLIHGSNVSALKSQLLRNSGYSRGHDIGYKESIAPLDVVAPRVKIGKRDEAVLEIGKFATISFSKSSSPVSQKRRSQRPKRNSNDRVVDTATPFTSANEKKSSLLSKQEEREFANQIRMLRTVVRIRDEIISTHNSQLKIWQPNSWQPTEGQWAKACGLSISELRRVIVEGQNARSQMVAANGGLVGSNAKWYLNSVTKANQAHGGVGTILSFHDLVQEGNLGLMEAAERFEPERGFRFSTYATWWVRQRMLRAISDYSRTIRLPAHGKLKPSPSLVSQ
jgi:DNA-directed RNA polymerase sigma subunit (sigma70/sigma32)